MLRSQFAQLVRLLRQYADAFSAIADEAPPKRQDPAPPSNLAAKVRAKADAMERELQAAPAGSRDELMTIRKWSSDWTNVHRAMDVDFSWTDADQVRLKLQDAIYDLSMAIHTEASR